MLETLRLVFGAVATKDIQPILTHVLVYPDRMQGGDGIITIDAPFSCALPPMAIPGKKFLNAVTSCTKEPVLTLTDTGRLSIKGGKFKAFLSLLPADGFPVDKKGGVPFPVPDNFIAVLNALRPFVSKDASRPWSMGLRFSQGRAFATNNIILASYPVDWTAPDVVLPVVAIEALINLRRLPKTVCIDDTSATFEYSDSTWLKTRLQTAAWPGVEAMLDATPDATMLVPEELLDAVQTVKRFCTNVKFPTVVLSNEGVSSDDGGGDIASVEGLNLHTSTWNADNLELVLMSATYIDFSAYPAPCSFKGLDGLKGIFIGIKT